MNERVDRRRARTRRYLGDAMIALLMEKPYDAITVQEIADRADVGRATLYMHYPDKHAVLIDALTTAFRDMADTLGLQRDDPRRPVPMRALFEYVGRRHEVFHVLLNGIGRSDVYLLARDTIAHYASIQLRRLPVRPSVPLDVIAVHLAGSLLNLVAWWLSAGRPHPPDVMERMGRALIGGGLSEVLGLPPGGHPLG